MRKLWHRLFGHGKKKGVAYGLVSINGVLYTTTFTKKDAGGILKQSTDGGSTWTEVKDA